MLTDKIPQLTANGGVSSFEDLLWILRYRYGNTVEYAMGQAHPFIHRIQGMAVGTPYYCDHESRWANPEHQQLISVGDTIESPKVGLTAFLIHLQVNYPLEAHHGDMPWLFSLAVPNTAPKDHAQLMYEAVIQRGHDVAMRVLELGCNDTEVSLISQGSSPEEAIYDNIRYQINEERAVRTLDKYISDELMCYWDEQLDMVWYRTAPRKWYHGKLTKLLQKIDGSLSGPHIDILVNNERASHGIRELLFTSDPSGIERAYTHYVFTTADVKPHASPLAVSCMRYTRFEKHPVRMYGHERHGHCALAYTKDANGDTLARVLCNTNEKQYSRVYAASQTEGDILERLLSEQGYKQDDDALMNLQFKPEILSSGKLAIPYVDYIVSASYDENSGHITLDNKGDVPLDSISGAVIVEPACHCCDCGTRLDPEDAYIYDDGYYCERCCERCALRDGMVQCHECDELMDPEDDYSPAGCPDDVHFCSTSCVSACDDLKHFTDGTHVWITEDDDPYGNLEEPTWEPEVSQPTIHWATVPYMEATA